MDSGVVTDIVKPIGEASRIDNWTLKVVVEIIGWRTIVIG